MPDGEEVLRPETELLSPVKIDLAQESACEWDIRTPAGRNVGNEANTMPRRGSKMVNKYDGARS